MLFNIFIRGMENRYFMECSGDIITVEAILSIKKTSFGKYNLSISNYFRFIYAVKGYLQNDPFVIGQKSNLRRVE